MNKPTDHNLVLAAQQGDLEAFNQLILQHQDFLFSLAIRMTADEQLASDMLQDACLLGFTNLASFHGGSFRNWLARILMNVCYDQFRRQRRRPTRPLELDQEESAAEPYWLADTTASPEAQLESRELEQTILQGLQKLSPVYRVVIGLIDLQDYSYEEAASMLQVPVGTIKSRLARGRAEMRKILKFESRPVAKPEPVPPNWNVCLQGAES